MRPERRAFQDSNQRYGLERMAAVMPFTSRVSPSARCRGAVRCNQGEIRIVTHWVLHRGTRCRQRQAVAGQEGYDARRGDRRHGLHRTSDRRRPGVCQGMPSSWFIEAARARGQAPTEHAHLDRHDVAGLARRLRPLRDRGADRRHRADGSDADDVLLAVRAPSGCWCLSASTSAGLRVGDAGHRDRRGAARRARSRPVRSVTCIRGKNQGHGTIMRSSTSRIGSSGAAHRHPLADGLRRARPASAARRRSCGGFEPGCR